MTRTERQAGFELFMHFSFVERSEPALTEARNSDITTPCHSSIGIHSDRHIHGETHPYGHFD